MSKSDFCVFTRPEDHLEGLFGKVCYHILQILPYLYERNLYPAWDIHTAHYGAGTTGATLPGAFALAYEPPKGDVRRVSALELRRRHCSTVGGDWQTLHHIWSAYFKVPQRIQQRAEALLPPGRTLGVHYRGTDKQTSSENSNPITPGSFIALVQDHLHHAAAYDRIFAATDDALFVERLSAAVNLPVLNLGSVGFFKADTVSESLEEKTERAVLDCVLLARCAALVETSSALPSFAKLLNPQLEAYRTAASKVFDPTPYFPVAYIPILPVYSDAAGAILRETMRDDWTADPKFAQYRQPFAHRVTRPLHHALFSTAEALGLGDRVTVHR